MHLPLIPFQQWRGREPGVVSLQPQTDHSRDAVFLIPGFLSEQELEYGAHGASLFRPEAPWVRHFRGGFQRPFDVFFVNWPASSMRRLLGALAMLVVAPLPAVVRGTSTWSKAVKAADEVSASLSETIAAFRGRVVVIGHSLGGRIACRLCERVTPGPPVAVIALAPAISACELNLACLADGLRPRLELFYSRSDFILKTFFRLGQMSYAAALGEVGPPREYENVILGHDVTDQDYCHQMGHGDYEKHLLFILQQRSRIWKEFSAPREPSVRRSRHP